MSKCFINNFALGQMNMIQGHNALFNHKQHCLIINNLMSKMKFCCLPIPKLWTKTENFSACSDLGFTRNLDLGQLTQIHGHGILCQSSITFVSCMNFNYSFITNLQPKNS